MRFFNDQGLGLPRRDNFGDLVWQKVSHKAILEILKNPAYAGAFVYGSLTYLFCIWSKSLGACVVMHAVANLLMGLYIMQTGKYGLW